MVPQCARIGVDMFTVLSGLDVDGYPESRLLSLSPTFTLVLHKI